MQTDSFVVRIPNQIFENSDLGVIVIVFFPRYTYRYLLLVQVFFCQPDHERTQSRPSRGAPAAPKKVPGAPSVRVTRVVTLRVTPEGPWCGAWFLYLEDGIP